MPNCTAVKAHSSDNLLFHDRIKVRSWDHFRWEKGTPPPQACLAACDFLASATSRALNGLQWTISMGGGGGRIGCEGTHCHEALSSYVWTR